MMRGLSVPAVDLEGARQEPPATDDYLPLRTLAGYSGLSVRTLRGYLVHPAHPLPHYRVGGKLLVKRSEFDDWMRGFRAAEPPRLDGIVADVLRSL
jgi:hypothetical protein